MSKIHSTSYGGQSKGIFPPHPYKSVDSNCQSKSLKLMCTMNNKFKGQLIESLHLQNQWVLDLGCGKGGDMFKFAHALIKGYVGMDARPDFVLEARKRLQEYLEKHKSNHSKEETNQCIILSNILSKIQFEFFTPYDFTKISEIQTMLSLFRKGRPNVEINLVTAFFSIHTIFKNDESMRAFCHNVDSILSKDPNHSQTNSKVPQMSKRRSFLCTFMDGKEIVSWMKDIQCTVIESKDNFTINATKSIQTSKWPDTVQLGMELDVSLNAQTVPLHTEYFTSLEILQKYMQECGFLLFESSLFSLFSAPSTLLPNEQRLFRCSRYAIFIRN